MVQCWTMTLNEAKWTRPIAKCVIATYGLSTLVDENGNCVSGNRRFCILKQATLLPKTATKLPFLATKLPVSGYVVAVFGNTCG